MATRVLSKLTMRPFFLTVDESRSQLDRRVKFFEDLFRYLEFFLWEMPKKIRRVNRSSFNFFRHVITRLSARGYERSSCENPGFLLIVAGPVVSLQWPFMPFCFLGILTVASPALLEHCFVCAYVHSHAWLATDFCYPEPLPNNIKACVFSWLRVW